MTTDILVPTLGESVTEATVARWLKQVGDPVKVDEPLVELETDKVTLEVGATEAGVVAEVLAGEGEDVEVGAVLGRIAPGDGKLAEAAPAAASTSATTPASVAPTSRVTLSVSSSTKGSSTLTGSPTCFNQRATVASVTDSPRVGTRMSAVIAFASIMPYRSLPPAPMITSPPTGPRLWPWNGSCPWVSPPPCRWPWTRTRPCARRCA